MSRSNGWSHVSFGDIATNVTERVDDPALAGVDHYVGLEHLDSGSLEIRRWGHPTDVEATKLRFCAGDVIFGRRRAYQRKLGVAAFDGICSAHALVLRAKPGAVAPEFLPFFMQSDTFFDRALAISVGSLSPTINWRTLASQKFHLPPIDEQREIARILWAVEATAKAYRTAQLAADGVRRARLAASLHAHGASRISLGEVAEVKNGTTPRRGNTAYWDDGTIPWLPTGKVKDRVIQSADEFITAQALQECSLSMIPRGSVLIAMIGQGKTRGTAAYLDISATINQNFAAVIPGSSVDGRFLFYFLETRYADLRRISQGSNQGALNCRIIREYKVPVPSLDEQRRVVEEVEAVERAQAVLMAQEARTREVKGSLLRTLTAGDTA